MHNWFVIIQDCIWGLHELWGVMSFQFQCRFLLSSHTQQCEGYMMTYQMETFSIWLALWVGNSLMNSPHKGQWCRVLMFSLICAWTSGWVNNQDAGDLKCHRTHYDVISIILLKTLSSLPGYRSMMQPVTAFLVATIMIGFKTCVSGELV